VQVYQAEAERWLSYPAPAGFDRNLLFVDQMRHFLEVAHGLVAPLCTLDDGIRALELALAAHQSQAQGRIIDLYP
jgi:predicted dehydrogenase